ncbi:unnamed protein product [Hermetia illucens]|uniref:Uncharacterized protein n=1 Tax=Hermetia illucens TaxID=343691 RepID=A0A7R8U9P3_HERIL|nr:keratin-associated protein 6-2-like [Hermetia illucens]CAD7076754.1 unnamed protein product [Hermetia illucens]
MIKFKVLLMVAVVIGSVSAEDAVAVGEPGNLPAEGGAVDPEGLLSVDAQQGHENESARKARQFGGGYGGGFGVGFGGGFGGGYGGGFGGGYGGGYGGGFGGGYRGGYAQRFRYRERFRYRQRFGYGGFYG